MESEEYLQANLKIISGLYEYFNANKITPDMALSAMIYMIPAIVQTTYQKPRELLVAISQDLLNLSQEIGKTVSEVKED